MNKYFEEVEIGDVSEIGVHSFTAEDIKTFAQAYDPQPFHIDEEAAKASHFGALCASGWHTAAVWMQLMVDFRKGLDAQARAEGKPVVELGPSPGFRDMRWLRPVYAGDTISYRSTVTGKRASASRPRWGLVNNHNEAFNQKGEKVFEFFGAVFWERRPDAA